MKIFDFYQNIKCGRKKVISSFSKLSNVYNHLPKTTGCTENISKCNGCGGWCCRYQSPQLLYVEFLHIWKNVLKYLEINEIVDIIERSLYNYIEGDTTKGCIFLNKENSYCKIYKYRPFNCRTYGMIPNEEFNKNKEKVKEKMKGILGLVIKDQCDLVKIEDGKELTSDIINDLWKELIIIEENIGVDSFLINDNIGGSYRSPHDHVLLYTMPEKMQDVLIELRKNKGSIVEKKMYIDKYIAMIRKNINNEKKG